MSSDDLLIALPAEAYTTLDASSYLDLTTPARLDGLVESCGTLTGEPQAVQPPPSPSTEPFPPSRPSFSVPFPPRHTQYNAQGVFPAEQQLEETLLCPGPVDLTFALPRHHGYPPPTLLTRLSSTMPPPSFPTNHLLALVPSKLHFWCSRKPTFTAHTGDCPTSAADLNALTSTTTNATRSPARGPNAPESYQAPARTPSHRFRIAHPSPALPPRPICSQPQAATKQQLQDQAFPPPPLFLSHLQNRACTKRGSGSRTRPRNLSSTYPGCAPADLEALETLSSRHPPFRRLRRPAGTRLHLFLPPRPLLLLPITVPHRLPWIQQKPGCAQHSQAAH
jgi:hypothetical protein